eukprot:TRINITY_DN7594_c0_g1_i4.p1 TRINITY_DN7594_c0_g1~~TRINITY_DN7594_c0_g1_i4.p1  ORF type:complete len:626 (+),score=154.93 TRINITY_DN7594_c0_g1_i4:78-1955(+)
MATQAKTSSPVPAASEDSKAATDPKPKAVDSIALLRNRRQKDLVFELRVISHQRPIKKRTVKKLEHHFLRQFGCDDDDMSMTSESTVSTTSSYLDHASAAQALSMLNDNTLDDLMRDDNVPSPPPQEVAQSTDATVLDNHIPPAPPLPPALYGIPSAPPLPASASSPSTSSSTLRQLPQLPTLSRACCATLSPAAASHAPPPQASFDSATSTTSITAEQDPSTSRPSLSSRISFFDSRQDAVLPVPRPLTTPARSSVSNRTPSLPQQHVDAAAPTASELRQARLAELQAVSQREQVGSTLQHQGFVNTISSALLGMQANQSVLPSARARAPPVPPLLASPLPMRRIVLNRDDYNDEYDGDDTETETDMETPEPAPAAAPIVADDPIRAPIAPRVMRLTEPLPAVRAREQEQQEQVQDDLQELLARQLVGSILNGRLRPVLELHVQERLEAVSANTMTADELHQRLAQRAAQRHQRQEHGNHQPAPAPPPRMPAPTQGWTPPSAAAPMATSSAANSQAIAQLAQQMAELQALVRASFQLQQDLRRSVRQEVAAALGGREVPDAQHTRAAARDGECVVCMEQAADTMMYRCGHLCSCLSCALSLKARGMTCPCCRAPVDDVVQVYLP